MVYMYIYIYVYIYTHTHTNIYTFCFNIAPFAPSSLALLLTVYYFMIVIVITSLLEVHQYNSIIIILYSCLLNQLKEEISKTYIYVVLYIYLCVVDRIMVSRRCSCPNLQNLWLCLHDKGELSFQIELRLLSSWL